MTHYPSPPCFAEGGVSRGNTMIKRITPGDRFGRLTVSRRDTENNNRKPYWVCDCDCGNTTTVRGDYLSGGKIISCGCFHKDKFKVSLENINFAGNLFSNNVSVEEIAKKMRISPSNVQKLLNQGGIEVQIKRNDLKTYREKDKLRWVKKYVFGMSLNDIAKAENTSVASVLTALNSMGIKTREPGSQAMEMVSRFKAKADEYWSFYSQGMSSSQIAKLYNLSSGNAVAYILKSHGYKLRSRVEGQKKRAQKNRIKSRKEIREIISERGVRLSESKKAKNLRKIEEC